MEVLGSVLKNHQEAIIAWSGVICTFGIFSILYKENPYYRLFEHIFIGLALGQGLFITFADVIKPKWWDPMVTMGQWWWMLALAVGAMWYFIYSPRNAWISRIIFGAFFGLYAGLAFQAFANTYFPMVSASFKPVIPAHDVPLLTGISTALSNIVFVVVLITVMAYFFFSVDHRARSMRGTAALGRWFLMFAFGAVFGSTVMARMALFIGRLDFMTRDWVPIVPLWFWIAAGGILVLIGVYLIRRPKPPKKMQEEALHEPVSTEAVTESEPT